MLTSNGALQRGAVGLLQLLPSTAAELEDPAPKRSGALEPERNAPLGARYLKEMLNAADGNPFWQQPATTLGQELLAAGATRI